MLEGFGGVSEYGITVRWDRRTSSTLLHLTLARRRGLKIYGGVRFGGTLPIEDAWTWGFDHVAIATGAGRPTVIDMKNNLIRGIRKASDFLMALRAHGGVQTWSAPEPADARVPAVVIGGGLTAIDTATELMAYYPLQVEKTLQQYEVLAAGLSVRRSVRRVLRRRRNSSCSTSIWRTAGRSARSGHAPEAAGEAPDFIPLVRAWGGITIAYRKRMVDSPAYRLNHEEVVKALEEGIAFAENLNPIAAEPDEHGAVKAVIFKREGPEAQDGHDATVTLPAYTVLVAAGTTPNITYEKEVTGTLSARPTKKKVFQPHVVVRDGVDRLHLRPDANGCLHLVRRGRPLQ